jgi:hypothetical protein
MPSKAETKSIKAEIRCLKATFTARRKNTLRSIVADRKITREATARITANEAALNRYEAEVNTRVAILEGRLSA